jgi:hypothetical protein
MEERRNTYNILVSKPEGKRILSKSSRPRRTLKKRNRMDTREIE